MRYCGKALELYSQGSGANIQPLIAAVYHGMGEVQVHRKDYSEALVLDSIGTVHRHLGQYKEAKEYHNHSLQIQQKSLPPLHQDIAKSFRSFGLLYEAKSRWERALSYYQKASHIYRQAMSIKHPDAIELQKDITRVSSNMK